MIPKSIACIFTNMANKVDKALFKIILDLMRQTLTLIKRRHSIICSSLKMISMVDIMFQKILTSSTVLVRFRLLLAATHPVRIHVYDKIDDFNFHITNSPFIARKKEFPRNENPVETMRNLQVDSFHIVSEAWKPLSSFHLVSTWFPL